MYYCYVENVTSQQKKFLKAVKKMNLNTPQILEILDIFEDPENKNNWLAVYLPCNRLFDVIP